MSDTNGAALPPLPEHLADRIYDETAPQDYSLHVPGRILLIEDLTLVEKALLAVIDSLHHNGSGCYGGNQYLSERVSVSVREVTRLIEKLEAKGYISVEHYRDARRVGGRIRFLIPTDQVPRSTPKTPSPRHKRVSGQSRQSVHTPTSNCPDTLDESARESGLVRACLEYEVNREKECETELASSRAREDKQPSRHAKACEEAFTGRADPPAVRQEIDADLAPAVELLMRPCPEGGAGFTRLESAIRVANARGEEELRHWILLARKRKMEDPAAFIYSRIVSHGDGPPESYLRAQKAALNGRAPRHRPGTERMESGPPPVAVSEGAENVGAYVRTLVPGLHPNDPFYPEKLEKIIGRYQAEGRLGELPRRAVRDAVRYGHLSLEEGSKWTG